MGMKNLWDQATRWIAGKPREIPLADGKMAPPALTGSQWGGSSMVDSYKRTRQPTANELLGELKNTAWTCASMNAAVCASFPPRLYVTTRKNDRPAKCRTAPLSRKDLHSLRCRPHLKHYLRDRNVEEVVEHPLLTLLERVNPQHNAFDLWELTTLYQEVHGAAYWYIERAGVLGLPSAIWLLPTQNVTPKRQAGSPNIVDAYAYKNGHSETYFLPEEIIHFRYPDPKDPYLAGLSPLRACYEQQALSSSYAAMKQAKFDNHAIPDALISPDEVIGEEERDRLEHQWNARFKKGGTGRVVVAESGLKVNLLTQSMGDLALLADIKASKEDICNAFHVPVSYMTGETNLANLEAADHQHMSKAVAPRLKRRDEKINEQLIPLYDDSGRLFVCSDDPTPESGELQLKREANDLRCGVLSINQAREARGLDPVPWGEEPWVASSLWPMSKERGEQVIFSETTVNNDNTNTNTEN